MRITILETGRPPAALRASFPDYPEQFATLLAAVDPGLSFEAVAVVDGAPTPDLVDTQAVLITGSPAGVYDDEPWIAPLEAFIRAAGAAGIPQVGICFGHQIMAQAFGGVVRKSDKGWGVGKHSYDVVEAPAWMDPPLKRFSLNASHQDQVIAPPPGAKTIARSAFVEHAALLYADAPALSFQGHPEMDDRFAAALVQQRRGTKIPEPVADAALLSLGGGNDALNVARWMAAFLRGG